MARYFAHVVFSCALVATLSACQQHGRFWSSTRLLFSLHAQGAPWEPEINIRLWDNGKGEVAIRLREGHHKSLINLSPSEYIKAADGIAVFIRKYGFQNGRSFGGLDGLRVELSAQKDAIPIQIILYEVRSFDTLDGLSETLRLLSAQLPEQMKIF